MPPFFGPLVGVEAKKVEELSTHDKGMRPMMKLKFLRTESAFCSCFRQCCGFLMLCCVAVLMCGLHSVGRC